MAVRGEGIVAVNRGVVLPIGEAAVGFLENGQERAVVLDGHFGIDHDLGAAGRHQNVAIRVVSRALQFGRATKMIERAAVAHRIHTIKIRCQQNGVF
jgi:hypothetical protein